MEIIKRILNMSKGFYKSIFSPFLALFITILSPFVAPIIAIMALTGYGTNTCLALKCLPMRVHFYSPVPDIADLEAQDVWSRKSTLKGIDFNPDRQIEFLRMLGDEYGHECRWPHTSTRDIHQFYTDNGSFSFGCAAALYSMIRHNKPRNIIEIGSGNSSLVINQALAKNAETDNIKTNYTIIDPYPNKSVVATLEHLSELIETRVELMDPDFFSRLSSNDILFIDSGHTVRIGSDVNYLILDVLPSLSPGVNIHFHDIPIPYEYPKTYAINPQFRQFWTESYLLQAFLCFNRKFEILLAMSYLMTEYSDTFAKCFPHCEPVQLQNTSGSFWMITTEELN
jgi:hypothetical protein